MARFEELGANRGVDSVPLGREWMIVPYRGDNLVRLADGAGFAVTAVSGALKLEVKEAPAKDWPRLLGRIGAFLVNKDDRLFRVIGKHPGMAKLRARKGTLQATLSVSVHKKLPLSVAFFFLQDQDAKGNVRLRTAFTPADADAWISGLNGVFGPQANIWFNQVRAELLPVPNLGAAVSADDAEVLARKKDPGAKINIFLAGSQIKSSDTSHPNGFYHIPQNLIILKDRSVTDPWSQPASPMLQTMAHEIGHLMNHARGAGQGHDFFKTSGYNSDILNTIDGSDIKIPHQRVLDWNPW